MVKDIRIAHSRDGERFTRIRDDQPLIPRGGLGEWDDGFLVIGDKIVIKDGTILLYYAEQDRSWTSWPPQNAPKGPSSPAGASRRTETGLGTLPVDRFTALATRDGESPGNALTAPLALPGQPCRLLTNVSVVEPQRSWCSIDLRDEAGRLLSGYAGDRLVTAGVDIPLTWQAGELARLRADRFACALRCTGVLVYTA